MVNSFITRYLAYSLGMMAFRRLMVERGRSAVEKPSIPSFKGVIELKHAIPGRLRFSIPKLRYNEMVEVAKQLSKVDGVETIEINSCIGSILIRYAEAEIEPMLVFGILIKLLGLEEDINRKPRSKVTGEIKTLSESLDMAIYEKSKGLLDTKSLLIIILLGVGIKKTATEVERPPGLNYVWWAYSLMSMV